MARILLFQHVPYEPLGVLSPMIREHGHRVRYVNFSREPEAIPKIDKYDGLIILGGPANVDQVDQYPYLNTEIAAIRSALDLDMPILGICLGCQLLAAAAGAKVYAAPTKEVGWTLLTPTAEGRCDPLIKHFQAQEMIFQWHGYTFDLPAEAQPLVTGGSIQNQAFRLGERAYGFQFHLEVTPPLIERWLELPNYQEDLVHVANQTAEQQAAQIRQETEQYISRSLTLAERVFSAFLDLLPKVDRRIHLPSR